MRGGRNKPHIRFRSFLGVSVWECISLGYMGCGTSPQLAYWAWKMEREPVARAP